MSGPFTTITVERFHKLADIFVAADCFLNVVAEFPTEPAIWGERIEALEIAVATYKKIV
jgi:hypothetical protein